MKYRMNIRTIYQSPWPYILLAVGLRLCVLPLHKAIAFDQAHYLRMAAGMAQGDWLGSFHPYWTPGYPFVAALVSLIIRNFELAGRLANILVGSLTILPIMWFSRQIFGREKAMWPALFYVFFPPLLLQHTVPLAEPAYAFFGFMGMWLGWKTLARGKILLALPAGLMFGLSYLSKPEGAGYLVVFVGIAGCLLLFQLFRRMRPRGVWVILLVCAGFLIAAFPYLLYLRSEAGYWTLSAKGQAMQQFQMTYFTPESDDVYEDLDPENTTFGMDEIFHDGTFLKKDSERGARVPVRMDLLIRKYFTHLYRNLKYGMPAVLTFPVFILFALGLFGRAWPRDGLPAGLYVLAFHIFYWFILLPMFVVHERYLTAMLPAAAIWIGQGGLLLKAWFERMAGYADVLRPQASRVGIGLTVLFAGGLSFIPETAKLIQNRSMSADEWADPVEEKMAGEWIKAHHSGSPPILMSRNKAVDFYAGNYNAKQGASFPLDPTERVLAYARYKGVEYFVVNERYLHRTPNIRAWIEETPEDLERVYSKTGPSGLKIWVFTWADSSPDSDVPEGEESR